MKKMVLLLGLMATTALSVNSWADGVPSSSSPVRHRRHYGRAPKEEIPPAPVCTPKSDHPKVRLVSWNPTQKISKFLGVLQECVSTQWDVLRLLSGPNTIGLHYPDEREMWGYLWLWSYKLQNPIEDTIILMDKSGKRILKGKNPVELFLTFNKDDVLERIEMTLVKKKNSQYVVTSP